MKKIYLLLIAAFLFNGTGKTQTTNWFEMMADPGVNFYTVKSAFNSYFATQDSTEKGKGWKQYKRWEWFM
ncbi:MAG: hypothetical protein ACHQF2_08575, partial [Flavobacteriales bacterium]